MLALFSSKPFALPAPGDTIDLAPHLTNSSLQAHRGEDGVRLLDELVGSHILSRGSSIPDFCLTGSDPDSTLTSDHLADIQDQVADALAETFTVALQSPIHFQVRSFFFFRGSGDGMHVCINILTLGSHSHYLTPSNFMELTFSSNTSYRLNHSFVSSFSKSTQNPR